MTEGLQTLDERGLVLRKYFGLEMPDTCLFRDMTGRSSAVARQHINVDPGGLQFAHGLYGAILDAVGDRRDSQGLLRIGEPDDALGFCRQPLRFDIQLFADDDSLLVEQPAK